MNTDGIFALIAAVAVGCFVALITLQYLEFNYYQDPLAEPTRVNIWQ